MFTKHCATQDCWHPGPRVAFQKLQCLGIEGCGRLGDFGDVATWKFESNETEPRVDEREHS